MVVLFVLITMPDHSAACTGELIVNDEYEKLIPPPTVEEYVALKDAIKKYGQIDSIIVNEEHEILDGHQRYRVCVELGLKPKHELETFANKTQEKCFVFECNYARRHFPNDYVKIETALPLLQLQIELAKLRQVALGRVHGRKATTDDSLASNDAKDSPQGDEGKATGIVARIIGVSSSTFERGLFIIRNGDEQLKHNVRIGATSISSAYDRLREILQSSTRKDNSKKEIKEQRGQVTETSPSISSEEKQNKELIKHQFSHNVAEKILAIEAQELAKVKEEILDDGSLRTFFAVWKRKSRYEGDYVDFVKDCAEGFFVERTISLEAVHRRSMLYGRKQ